MEKNIAQTDEVPKTDLDLFLFRYPGLVAEKTQNGDLYFQGNVKIKDTWFYLKFCCPQFPMIKSMVLKVHELSDVKTFSTSSAGVDPNWTAFEVVENLPHIIGEKSLTFLQTLSSGGDCDIPQQNYYMEIARLYAPELYQISLDAMTTRVHFSNFKDHEEHYLKLQLQPKLQIISHSLPDCVIKEQDLLQKNPTINALLQQFRKFLDDLSAFYNNVHDIDELCYVLQPSPPTTKDNWRLFLLRQNVFLKLLIADPFVPTASMSMHIIGPTADVEQLRNAYSEGLTEWDPDLNIHKNLLRIFDLCFFPMPLNEDESHSDQSCKICFDYQSNDNEIPLVSCDNKRCAVIYHASCLKKWFNTLTDSKVFLDVSFGECPFCKAKLSTSFTELLE